jgi:hypothetical protein
MGDYVLESNPALERLIERLCAPGEPPLGEASSNSNEHARRFRRGRHSKVHAAGHPELLRGDPTAGDATETADRHLGSPSTIAEEEPAVLGNFWAIHEDPQPTDEMVLVDFDEEPEVFDEDPGEYERDRDETDDADEILDVYEDEDEDEDEEWNNETILDEGAEVLDEDRHEVGDWIFEAFEVWRLEYDAGLVDASTPHP